MKYFSILFLFFIYNSSQLSAQNSEVADTISIITKTDSLHAGVLINITKDSITIYNEEGGLMSFSKTEIKFVKDGLIKKTFDETPNLSVPFYVQTARTNGRGNHYYKNYYLFGNELNYGATDNLNLTIGFETASLIFDGGERIPIIQLGAKYGVPTSDIMNFAISSKYYFNDEGSVLFVSAPFTFGSEHTNFTVSPNYFRTSDDSEIVLLANLSITLSSNMRLVIDYGAIDGEKPLVILLEHVFKSGFSLSIGTYSVAGFTIPNLSFSIPFGKWKNMPKYY